MDEPLYLQILPFGREHLMPPRTDNKPRTYSSISRYDRQTCRRVLDAIAIGATMKIAASYAGVDQNVLEHWTKIYPEFAAAVRIAKGEMAVAALARIQQAAEAGEWRAMAWLLTKHHPETFGKPDESTQRAAGGTTVSVYLPANARFAMATGPEPLALDAPAEHPADPPADPPETIEGATSTA